MTTAMVSYASTFQANGRTLKIGLVSFVGPCKKRLELVFLGRWRTENILNTAIVSYASNIPEHDIPRGSRYFAFKELGLLLRN